MVWAQMSNGREEANGAGVKSKSERKWHRGKLDEDWNQIMNAILKRKETNNTDKGMRR